MNTEYRLIRSQRKTVAIQITGEGEVLVRAPKRCSQAFIEQFLTEKQEWIKRQTQRVSSHREEIRPMVQAVEALGEAELRFHRSRARALLLEKTQAYAALMGVSYGRVTVRQQKTRWGSCSRSGNLSFNWRLVFAPEAVMDYVVIHELCHRTQMNHSPKFWALVEEFMLDYKRHRDWLRMYGDALL